MKRVTAGVSRASLIGSVVVAFVIGLGVMYAAAPSIAGTKVSTVTVTSTSVSTELMRASTSATSTSASSSSPNNLTPLTVGSTVGGAGEPLFDIALSEGYFQQQGLNVKVDQYTSGAAEKDAVATGAIDLGQMGQTPFLSMITANVSVVTIGQLTVGNAYHMLIVKKGLNITSPTQLYGLTLGVTFGSDSYYMTYAMFNQTGLDSSKIKLVNLNPPSLLSAYKQGQIDGISFLWSPWIEEALNLSSSTILARDNATLFGGQVVPFPQGEVSVLLFANPQWATTHEATVVAFLKAIVQAQQFFESNKQLAIQTVAQDENISIATADSYLLNGINMTVSIHEPFISNMQNEVNVMYHLNDFKSVVNVTNFVYSQPLAQADPSHVTITGGFTSAG